VIGLGLIGGSLARGLARTYDVVGSDPDPATVELARAAGLQATVSADAAVADADLVVVAAVLAALPEVIADLAGRTAPRVVVTDVGSVKRPAYESARAAGMADRFVGGHPMAGTEHSGFAAGDPTLFERAAWVLCLEADTDLPAWMAVAAMVLALGARVVPSTVADHDAAVARISHVPHLVAAAIAAEAAVAGPLALTLAAGSFRDGTRVAAGDPALSGAMCRTNREAVNAAMAGLVTRLDGARTDAAALLQEGNRARRAWTERATRAVEFDAADDDLRSRLLAHGRAGGWLDSVASSTLSGQLPTAQEA